MKMGDNGETHDHMDSGMRSLMDDLGLSMDMLRESSIFVPDPEICFFPRICLIPRFHPVLLNTPLVPVLLNIVVFRAVLSFFGLSVFILFRLGLWAMLLTF